MRKILTLLLFLNLTVGFSNELTPEQKTNLYFEKIKNNHSELLLFLQDMPKGGDLHNHLGGASMAEHMISYAQGDHLCINLTNLSVLSGLCPPTKHFENQVKNPTLYQSLVNAWSMRNFVPGKESGHDHFFDSFNKYFPIVEKHSGDILAEVSDRAGHQREIYLELMVTPDNNASGLLGKKIGWNPDLTLLREKLVRSGIHSIVKQISSSLSQDETRRNFLLQCNQQNAQPGCKVKVRYLYQILREQEPEQVFAQLLTGFMLASEDHCVVGINMVQPEDGTISMRDYELHMKMVRYLHQHYPNVHIALHAGELIPQLVPPEGLRSHIYQAVTVAGADRIGHGVDIAHEEKAQSLLKWMSQKKVMVEINLKSNEAILGVKGNNHPLPLYLSHEVPVALSTDDEGVLRTDLTEQFELAVSNFNFSYATLKKMIRNSIHFSFLPGQSLWVNSDYKNWVSVCAPGSVNETCSPFLQKNEKAEMEWKLEKQFHDFEAQF